MDAEPSARLFEEVARLRNDVAAAEVISALNDAGIQSILLKGPSVARWRYDEGESRIYGDVDLMVSPQTFEKTEEVVASLGFKRWKLSDRLERAHRQRPWYREQDLVVLELHQGFVGIEPTHQKQGRAVEGQRTVAARGARRDRRGSGSARSRTSRRRARCKWPGGTRVDGSGAWIETAPGRYLGAGSNTGPAASRRTCLRSGSIARFRGCRTRSPARA